MNHSLLSIRELTSSELEPPAQEDEIASPVNILKKEFAECKSRPEWCFIAEHNGQIAGLLGYRAPAAHSNFEQTPETLILFSLYLQWDNNYLEVGQKLLEQSFAKLRLLGVSKIKWNFDSAEFWGETLHPYPHWQQQLELAHHVGMSLRQEKLNYVYHAPIAVHSAVQSRLICRTLQEVGEAAYIEAIRLVTEETLDRSDAELRCKIGTEQAAQHFFNTINDGMKYEPRLWKLGYTPNDRLAGLIAPLKMWSDIGTLGYIGVVPEHRGNGYGVDLLQQGNADLQAEGIRKIIADTDALNVPMQRTFERVGYQLQGRSWSYEVLLSL